MVKRRSRYGIRHLQIFFSNRIVNKYLLIIRHIVDYQSVSGQGPEYRTFREFSRLFSFFSQGSSYIFSTIMMRFSYIAIVNVIFLGACFFVEESRPFRMNSTLRMRAKKREKKDENSLKRVGMEAA